MVHSVMESLQSSLRVLLLTLIVVCTALIKISNPEHACIVILLCTCRAVLGDDRPAEDHTLAHTSNCHEVSDESWR